MIEWRYRDAALTEIKQDRSATLGKMELNKATVRKRHDSSIANERHCLQVMIVLSRWAHLHMSKYGTVNIGVVRLNLQQNIALCDAGSVVLVPCLFSYSIIISHARRIFNMTCTNLRLFWASGRTFKERNDVISSLAHPHRWNYSIHFAAIDAHYSPLFSLRFYPFFIPFLSLFYPSFIHSWFRFLPCCFVSHRFWGTFLRYNRRTFPIAFWSSSWPPVLLPRLIQ